MKKNILILPTDYPNIYNDHTAIFVEDQARALAKHEDVDVSVIGAIPISFKDIWKKKIFKFGYFEYKKHDLNVTLLLFPSIPKLKSFNNFIRYVLNKKLIGQYSKLSRIDLIHVHNSVAGEAALWSKENHNIPYCVTEHSSRFAKGLVTKKELNEYVKVYNNSSYNIAVSQEFCDLLENIYNLRFYYVPNVVDTNFFKPKIDSKNIFTFINVGYLDINKNQTNLIKAFSKAFKDNENVNLLILGNGSEYENLKKEIEINGMQKQITLYGFATRDEVLKELQGSDAFVLSSDYETFGVVLIEAMSCGLPVVATKCGGPESIIIDKKLGVLTNKSVKALADGMRHIYETVYNSTEIREHIVKNFSEKIVAERLINIYKIVLNES